MKIVLIDDDPQVLSVLSRLIQRRGHQVLTYDSPLACPIYTSTHCPCVPEAICPDIIISDIDMPKVNGMKFIERVFQKGCKCKQLALISGQGVDYTNSNRMTKMGATIFTKPLAFDAFVSWLIRAEQTTSEESRQKTDN